MISAKGPLAEEVDAGLRDAHLDSSAFTLPENGSNRMIQVKATAMIGAT
jgi:hypothetical protein